MNNKLYDIPLSEIYSESGINDTGILAKELDKNGFTFGWDYKSVKNDPKKIFYALGCSWIHSNYFIKTFINDYPEWFLINKSFGGNGNSLMIDTLKKDMVFLESLKVQKYFLISFSEVGRNKKDFSYADPRNFTSSHDYFAEILKKQYEEVCALLKDQNVYITTSFVKNNFNNNNTILDFCGRQKVKKPDIDVYHYGVGIHEYMRDRKTIFPFDHQKDIEAILLSEKWVTGHEFVDHTLHVNAYDPYEKFLMKLNL